MIRSGRAGLVVVVIGVLVGAGALLSLVFRQWTIVLIAAGVFVATLLLATVLVGLADPEQLKQRSAVNERYLTAWARSMGRAAGGWDAKARGRTPSDKEDDREAM